MFISRGPPGSLQAHIQTHRHVRTRTKRKIYAVSLVTFIEWEVPCFFIFFPHSLSAKRPYLAVCVCACARECVCACVCAVFQPRGHASGAGSHYICHCLRCVASIFRRTRLALALKDRLVLSLPFVSVAPSSPSSSSSPAISVFASPVILSAVRCTYFHHNGFYFTPNQKQRDRRRCCVMGHRGQSDF